MQKVKNIDKSMHIKEKIQTFLHNFLGWGFPLKRIGDDGFQTLYSCKFCKYLLTKDSTAWFHLSK